METTQENEAQEPRYKEALNELEQILDQIEGGEVDLDDLGAKVERAAALIQL
jgi:exodeoxyribonuclease VII small subunit